MKGENVKHKLLIGIPTSEKVDTRFVTSLMNSGVYLLDRGYGIDIRFNEGSLIFKQRNALAEIAYETEHDLLFIDSDMTFKGEDVEKLISSNKDIIGGLCYSRREPYYPVVYKEYVEKECKYWRMKPFEFKSGVFKCASTGTAMLHIKHKVLKTLFDPEFIKEYGYPFNMIQLENGDQLGEDLSFCYRIEKYTDFDVFCDQTVDIGHIGGMIISKKTYEAYHGKK